MPSGGVVADGERILGFEEKEDIFREKDDGGEKIVEQSIKFNYSISRRAAAVPCGPGDQICLRGMLCCLLTFALIIILAIVLPLVLPVVFHSSSSSKTVDVATNLYSHGDSRLRSYSSFFCESISVEADSAERSVSLALVNAPPLLTGKNSFNVTDQRTLQSRHFHFWQYHLHPNSNISISICNTLYRRNEVHVYIVKGKSNGNKWVQSPSSVHAKLFRSVRERCPQEAVITYNVHEEDEYFVFVYNPLGFTLSSISYSAALKFERFEYGLHSKNACSTSSRGKCTMDIPFGTGSQLALVVTTIPENVDWSEKFNVNISCIHRNWAYIIVIILPLIVIIIIIGLVVICLCLISYKTEQKVHKTFI